MLIVGDSWGIYNQHLDIAMSAGPGQLQRSILERLNSSKPILWKVLLWDVAFARNEINKGAGKWDDIEEGGIKKSFVENFRRGVRSLEISGKIHTGKEKFTTLEETLDFIPYLSTRLELYHLGKKLLPDIKSFVKEERSMSALRIDFEMYQVNQLRRDRSSFQDLLTQWNDIETRIRALLAHAGSVRDDFWLNILLRGRYIFKDRREEYKIPLFALIKRVGSGIGPEEGEIYFLLQDLVSRLSNNPYWKIGEMKTKLYRIFHAEKFAKGGLSKELKSFLFNKNVGTIRSLPGHQEPDPKIFHGRAPDEFRKFSPLLDQLINRHILRPQIYIELV